MGHWQMAMSKMIKRRTNGLITYIIIILLLKNEHIIDPNIFLKVYFIYLYSIPFYSILLLLFGLYFIIILHLLIHTFCFVCTYWCISNVCKKTKYVNKVISTVLHNGAKKIRSNVTGISSSIAYTSNKYWSLLLLVMARSCMQNVNLSVHMWFKVCVLVIVTLVIWSALIFSPPADATPHGSVH